MGMLDGKVAVVTGAARGLGRAYSKRLAALGAKVAVADLNLRSYEEFEAEAKDMTAETTVAEIEAAGAQLSESRSMSVTTRRSSDLRAPSRLPRCLLRLSLKYVVAAAAAVTPEFRQYIKARRRYLGPMPNSIRSLLSLPTAPAPLMPQTFGNCGGFVPISRGYKHRC
jgi:NAD(P)-dependent dehydrogenase (short-subunit alcohol dehydrogenase family)